MLVPQETAFSISSKSTCLQGHQRLTQTSPQIQATQGQDRGGVEFIPCCTAGAERLAEGLGDRSLERTEPAAERAAGLGLAVGQHRGTWKGREKDKRRGKGQRQGGKRKEQQG